jgi:hypothetical protein
MGKASLECLNSKHHGRKDAILIILERRHLAGNCNNVMERRHLAGNCNNVMERRHLAGIYVALLR